MLKVSKIADFLGVAKSTKKEHFHFKYNL